MIRHPFCRHLVLGSVLSLTSLAGACASAFQPHFEAPPAPAKPVVVSELLAPKPRTERPVLVGVTTDPMRLFAWDLERSQLLWERPVRAHSAPLVVSDAVVLQEAEGVVVRDLATGNERVNLGDRAKLIGADGEAGKLVVSLAYEDKISPAAVVFIDGDSVRWRQKLTLPVGVPAVSGNYVSVPWATQRLSILAAKNGNELSRMHFKNGVLGHVLVDRGHVYVGQLGLTRLTPEMIEHPENKLKTYEPHRRSLPAQPSVLRDGYAPVPEPDNAQHRLQLSWRLAEAADGTLHTENDLATLRFYRLLFGLDANSDQLRWVRSFEHELVGLASVPGALLVVDNAGTLRTLDPQGHTRAQASLGRALRMATLRPGSWQPSAAADANQAQGIEPHPEGLREQLSDALLLPDDRLVAARAYAVNQLARDPSADITTQLIAVCAERKTPELVRSAACAELRERTSGDAAVLAMLRVRGSFLEGTETPPVGPLAQAAAKMQLKQAGPLLVTHIEDPNTPVRDLVAVFRAVESLQEPSAAASVERFVRLHHAEPEGSELLPALSSALHVLGTLRTRTQRATLLDVANDLLTPKPTRDAAQAALSALDAPAPQTAAPAAPVKEARPRDEVQTDPRPYALTPEVVSKALSAVREPLGRCLAADPSRPHAGRANLVVDAAGNVEGVFVLPATLQPCAEPVLRGAKFPRTRLGRQRITHVWNAPNAQADGATKKPANDSAAKKPASGGSKPTATKGAAKKP